ncbi:hypothetical protein JL720_16030 [Aureococcus anophagefferens]|nr:hypothetical protein JL720_16030 [Aureococcus anophagefferens]
MVQDFVARAAALGDRAAVEALGVPFTVAVSELSQIFAECAFAHGYTHNDLHGGNVLVTAPERAPAPRPASARGSGAASSPSSTGRSSSSPPAPRRSRRSRRVLGRAAPAPAHGGSPSPAALS